MSRCLRAPLSLGQELSQFLRTRTGLEECKIEPKCLTCSSLLRQKLALLLEVEAVQHEAEARQQKTCKAATFLFSENLDSFTCYTLRAAEHEESKRG